MPARMTESATRCACGGAGAGDEPLDGLKERRVIGDDRGALLADRLLGDALGEINREQDQGRRGPAVGEPMIEADVVPIFGEARRGDAFDRGDEVGR